MLGWGIAAFIGAMAVGIAALCIMCRHSPPSDDSETWDHG